MASVPYTLSRGTAENLGEVRKLVREAASWLRGTKNTDQWSGPWPDPARRREHMRSDLLRGKTWLVRDDATVVGTITLDTEEPCTADGRPVWPAHERHELAVYVRRVIVSRRYAHLGIGAALLDWAAATADFIDYPSQAMFERWIEQAGEGHANLFVHADSPGPHDPAGDPGNTLSRPARRD